MNFNGGIIDIEVLINVLNVMLFDLLMNELIWVGFEVVDGKKVWVVKKFGK